jgi:hypothetical protein
VKREYNLKLTKEEGDSRWVVTIDSWELFEMLVKLHAPDLVFSDYNEYFFNLDETTRVEYVKTDEDKKKNAYC